MPKKITRYSCNICGTEYEREKNAERCESVGIARTLSKGTVFITEPGPFQTKNNYWQDYFIINKRIGTQKHNAIYNAAMVYMDSTGFEVPAPFWAYSFNSQIEVTPGNYLFHGKKPRTRILSESEIEQLTQENSVFKKARGKILGLDN